jgi:hypothetical protein
VIVPIIAAKLSEAECAKIYDTAKQINATLLAAGVRSHLDDRDNYTSGWKYNHWELKGLFYVPLPLFLFIFKHQDTLQVCLCALRSVPRTLLLARSSPCAAITAPRKSCSWPLQPPPSRCVDGALWCPFAASHSS